MIKKKGGFLLGGVGQGEHNESFCVFPGHRRKWVPTKEKKNPNRGEGGGGS